MGRYVHGMLILVGKSGALRFRKKPLGFLRGFRFLPLASCGSSRAVKTAMNQSEATNLCEKAFNPHLAACTSNAEQSRTALVHCMICRPVNPAGFIGKSCKNPVRIVLAHVQSTCAPLAENPKRSDDFARQRKRKKRRPKPSFNVCCKV